MPDECPSIRSMARNVLPVLVGPSTAVTPAPRRRPSRVTGDENEIGIRFPGWGGPLSAGGLAFVYHNATPDQRALNFGNESGTNPARIGDSGVVEFRSRRYLAGLKATATTWGSKRCPDPAKTHPILNDRAKHLRPGSQSAGSFHSVDKSWITGMPGALPQAITAAFTASLRRPPRPVAAPPRRTELPASHPCRSASGSKSGTAPARGLSRWAPARPPCRAGSPDI